MSEFVWYDLMTRDVEAARTFYGDVVGWQITDSGMPGMNYSVIKAGGIEVGGIMSVPPSAPGRKPLWNGYIHSSDVDADVKKAVKLGGKIRREATDIPGVGRFAVIADPADATFFMFKPNSNQAPTLVPENTPGHVGWRELQSVDWKKAWAFYSTMFGWTKGDGMDMGPMGTYQQFKIGDKAVGGMMTKMPQDQNPPHWNYYFVVKGIEAAVERVQSRGGKILFGPDQVPGGFWIINGRDPQGALFSLLSLSK